MLEAVTSRPVVMVVEDRPDSLRIRKELLKSEGFVPLGVSSLGDAVREYRACPGIDLVVTDINLDAEDPNDKSGVEVARQIRTITPDVPIVGYSAFLSENDLLEDEWSIFNRHFPKGKVRAHEMDQHIGEWKGLAEQFRRDRMTRAEEQLRRLRDRYGIGDADFETLRSLVPVGSPLALAEDDSFDEAETIEDILKKEGYRVRLIEPGFPAQVEGAEVLIGAPLILWLHNEEDLVVAEIYGFPELYSYADSEEEAVSKVLSLMDGFYRELVSEASAAEVLGPVARRLRDFLLKVFGGR